MQPGYIYTLTTTSGQAKGAAASPGQGTLTLPYSDNFDSSTAGQQPRYLSQMQGAFEAGPCAGGRSGQCVQQPDRADAVEGPPGAGPVDGDSGRGGGLGQGHGHQAARRAEQGRGGKDHGMS